jgi:hypothetical protein
VAHGLVLQLVCWHSRFSFLVRHRPTEYHSLGPLAPKPHTHKLIGMLGAIICAATIIFIGYMSVGVTGESTASLQSAKPLLVDVDCTPHPASC